MTNDADFLPAVGPTKEERTWAMLCHLCIVAEIFLPILVLGPLVIWLIKSDALPFVKVQGKEVLNFQITLFLAGIVSWILVFAFGLGILLLAILGVYSVIAGVIGAVKVNEGVPYRYAFNLRLIS
ncbi:MAG TPA: DUF4870 domain-containing protein [Spongiibacteraceae bacterium]|nr:DUF4870 domain-containing protein [Spongiibacteraceae bacterium]